MDIKIIDKNLDYSSLNFQFSNQGNPEIAKYIRDEIASQVIADTTLAHNRWQQVPGRKNIFRSSGGLSLLIYSNKFIIQPSGEAFLYLDEFDIKDILLRAQQSIQKNRRFDFERSMDIDLGTSIGRLDSQITVTIHKDYLDSFFSFKDLIISGREREFRQTVNGKSVFTGRSWIRNRETDIYQFSSDELKKSPQTEIKKRDFIRVYDKLIEIIETTLPHSDKRLMLINKYSEFIDKDHRIFRIEIQEMDRGLTKHLNELLNTEKATFCNLADERLRVFAKRNPFKMWEALLGDPGKEVAQK